jgi:hypothetical protein
MNSLSNISNFYSNTNKVKAKEIEENKDFSLELQEDGVENNLKEKSLR